MLACATTPPVSSSPLSQSRPAAVREREHCQRVPQKLLEARTREVFGQEVAQPEFRAARADNREVAAPQHYQCERCQAEKDDGDVA